MTMLESRALLTDLYQLTMAQGYWRNPLGEQEACFYVHYRENPFKGGYSIACGLEQIRDYIENYGFTDEDCDYLSTIKTAEGIKMFADEFILSLRDLKLTIDIDAVAEGTVIFPFEPLLCVRGPILQCQLVETPLLNIFNFETLVATKAARVCEAARGPVAEFGLRRAQGLAGGLLASRAAFIGGCASTSNVEAGKIFGLPVSGTHAHSWVMAHDSELEAFRAFVREFPHNATLVIDTYDALAGVKNAITVAREMEGRGEKLMGIRIDSGDLAWLSIQARTLLDDAGLDYVKIVASNDLDEYTIQSLHEQGARIDLWGVGTKLVTAFDQPALSGVYKLSATRRSGDTRWIPQLKVSEQIIKATLPGLLATRRYYDAEGVLVGDMIYDEQLPPADDMIIDPHNDLRRKDLTGFEHVELLEPCIRAGRSVGTRPTAVQAQENTRANLERLHPTNKRFLNPHTLPVGLSRELHEQRDRIFKTIRAID